MEMEKMEKGKGNGKMEMEKWKWKNGNGKMEIEKWKRQKERREGATQKVFISTSVQFCDNFIRN